MFKSLRLKPLADVLFRRPGSNRGYRNGDILTTLVAMLNDGATSLSGVSRLRTESALLKLVGIRKIAGVNTLSRWLYGQGQAGVRLINKLNQTVLATTLAYRRVTEVTLAIDATVIETEKATATRTYQKCPNYTIMVGTIVEVYQVVAAQLHHGYVSAQPQPLCAT